MLANIVDLGCELEWDRFDFFSRKVDAGDPVFNVIDRRVKAACQGTATNEESTISERRQRHGTASAHIKTIRSWVYLKQADDLRL